MHIKYNIVIYILLNILFLIQVKATDRFQRIDSLLTAKSSEIPALNEAITISVSDVPVEEFLRGVANTSGLNLDIQPGINYNVINNFRNAQVKNVLVYICRQYDLDIQISGNIISLFKPRISTDVVQSVTWDNETQLVSFDFGNIPVQQAVREISIRTKTNVICSPDVGERTIKGYFVPQPLPDALENLAYANGLIVKKTENNVYMLEPKIQTEREGTQSSGRRQVTSGGRSQGSNSGGEFVLEIKPAQGGNFSIYAEKAPVDVLIKELSEKASFSYMITPDISDIVTVNILNADIEDIFNNLFKGSETSYRYTGNMYVIGEKSKFDFTEDRVLPLRNRSIDKLVESIPDNLTKNLKIIEFAEMNSLFVSGPSYQIDQLELFLKDIDKVVPVILIEVIILYVSKNYNISTGLTARLGSKPAPTLGTVFPGVDLQIGSEEINRVLDNTGWINLGKVTPNFYVVLQALEEQGYINMESTPKLATLNGHEAELSIGNTEYYLEEQTQLFGTQNPQQTTTQQYKAVNAELSIKIRPIVSSDGQITLEVEVHQSDFTDRISKTAPPGSVNRDFTSQIRVRDQETILLGGLMEKKKSNSGSGIPFLSRLPVLKWIFSSRKYEDSDSKLNVLIKPTIIN